MRAVLVVALIACGSKPPPVVEAPPPPKPTVRLPRHFVPTSYDLQLAIDPAKPKLDGVAAIAGTLSDASRTIWLHADQLEITKATARQGSREIELAVTLHGAEHLLELRAPAPLEPGEWTLHVTYRGVLDPVNTTGAFRQSVGNDHYVFTQLEAIYARRVFPSFDEPNVKVPFKLAFDIPKALTVVANTPQMREQITGETKRVEFAVTKPLPTYLVAFGIGPFEIVDAGKSKRGTPLRMVTLRGRGAEAAYAAQTSARIVDAAEDYFGIPYPYEKLDMLTIPLTVGFGAMENAGLITYTERLMLLSAKASQEQRRSWILVAAHEVAHQWFGNLVTPEFWDDIWLNEGFATWLAYKLAAQLEPQWKDSDSPIGTRHEALENDALVSARRVRQPIEKTDDIRNAFDRITYAKGAAVLFMFERFLGPDVFQRGVREYMQAKAWGNATSTDFVAAIAKAAGKPVDQAFASFLDQAGAPELAMSCDAGKVTLAQKRYLPPGAPEPPTTTPWIVPVCLAYDANGKRRETCTLLDKPTATVTLDKTCPRWILPNATGLGYYRVAFTVPQLTALRDEAWPKLTWPERRALVHDVTTAARAGKLPLQLALSFTPKLLAGNDRFTVAQAVTFATKLEPFVPDELRPKYEHWLRTQFGAAAKAAGLVSRANDTLDVEETRDQLVVAVAWYGREPALVAEAARLADRWRELPEALRPTILEIAADARPEVFDKLLREVATEPERAKRNDMYGALGAVRDPVRFKAALSLMLDTKVDIRESMNLLFSPTVDATREVAKQFLREHKDAIFARIPNAEVQRPLARFSTVFTQTCKAAERDAIADYVTKTFAQIAGGERVVKQAIESMDQCIAKRKLLDPELRAWLGGLRLPKT